MAISVLSRDVVENQAKYELFSDLLNRALLYGALSVVARLLWKFLLTRRHERRQPNLLCSSVHMPEEGR